MPRPPLLLRLSAMALPVATTWCLAQFVAIDGIEQPVAAARIYGGPTPAGARTHSLQIEVVQVHHQTETVLPRHPLTVTLGRPSVGRNQPAPYSGQTNDWGIAEVLLESDPSIGPDALVVSVQHRPGTSLHPEVLAQGILLEHLPAWKAARPRDNRVPGTSSGAFRAEVSIGRGTLAVPFPDRVDIALTFEGNPVPHAPLALSLVGAKFLAEGSKPTSTGTEQSLAMTSNALGVASVPIVPLSHAIELTVQATTPNSDGASRWYGSLPVTPGALALERVGMELTVRSPIERDHAHVRYVSRQERLGAQWTALRLASNGTSEGTLTIPGRVQGRLEAGLPVWAITSSDAHGPSGGAVGWSLLNTHLSRATTFAPPDVLLVDGVPEAQRAEARRAARARRWGLITALGLMCLFGLVMFQRWKLADFPSKT